MEDFEIKLTDKELEIIGQYIHSSLIENDFNCHEYKDSLEKLADKINLCLQDGWIGR